MTAKTDFLDLVAIDECHLCLQPSGCYAAETVPNNSFKACSDPNIYKVCDTRVAFPKFECNKLFSETVRQKCFCCKYF